MATVLFVTPSIANAAGESSALTVSSSSVARGGTLTVTEQLTNTQSFTVTGAKAALYGKESALPDAVDVVSCTGTTAPCGVLGGSIRGGVGDLAGGATATVVFTLQVKDTAPAGALTLQSQFVGDNYAFETLDGPAVTITGAPLATDLKVAISGAPSGLMTVEYTVKVTNNGPAAATGVRLASTYSSALNFGRGTGCVPASGTRVVNCDFASLAVGASATAKFTGSVGLLSVGEFITSVKLASSTPADSTPANNSASVSCGAVTGLLVNCS
jgi:uncharacterized repeat protein (TIGR01451 family)